MGLDDNMRERIAKTYKEQTVKYLTEQVVPDKDWLASCHKAYRKETSEFLLVDIVKPMMVQRDARGVLVGEDAERARDYSHALVSEDGEWNHPPFCGE
jgi:hypothetical protein